MPTASAQRDHRRRLIRELLRSERIQSQDELRKRLRAAGVRAEQATLSRDLHAMGVVKGPDGYVVLEASVSATPAREELRSLLRQYLASVEHAGNLLVVRTGPGRAQPVALALDNARLPGVLGSIAGDDTIFIAVQGSAGAERLAGLLRDIAAGARDETAFDQLASRSAGRREAVRR